MLHLRHKFVGPHERAWATHWLEECGFPERPLTRHLEGEGRREEEREGKVQGERKNEGTGIGRDEGTS